MNTKGMILAVLLAGYGLSAVGSEASVTSPCPLSIQALAQSSAEQAFIKKWRSKWEYWQQGVADYGWPKAFFTEMAKAMPKRFKMTKVASEGGLDAYSFRFYVDDDQYYEGGLIFQGSKLYAFELNSFG